MLQASAVKFCADLGSSLALPSSKEENHQLQKFMDINEIEEAWLGLTMWTHSPKWIKNKSIFFYFHIIICHLVIHNFLRTQFSFFASTTITLYLDIVSKNVSSTFILAASEVSIDTKSFNPSYGCGLLDRRRKTLGFQRCHLKLDGFICQANGMWNNIIS